MNFFLDENFPKTAESVLSVLGHNVFDIRGTELSGADDLDNPLVTKTAPEYTLFVAVPNRVYDDSFDEPRVALAIEANQIPLIIVGSVCWNRLEA